MNRTIIWLGFLLIAQLVLTLLIYRPPQIMTRGLEGAPLVRFNSARVTEITVDDDRDQEAVIRLEQGRWVLPELSGLPADAGMVNALIGAITATDHGWPVAKSVPARQRCQVAAYHYRRRITLIGSDELLGTVYLGTSPGFRQVHARNDSGEAIYSINLNAYDAPGLDGEWIDRDLLQSGNPKQLELDDVMLSKIDNQWLTQNGEAPDDRELQALLLALSSLQIEGVADEDDQRSLAEASPERRIEIATDDDSHSLELFSLNGRYAVYDSRYPLFFAISDYNYQRLLGINIALIAGNDPTGE